MMEEAVHLTGWVDILVNCVNLRRAFLFSQTIGWQLFQTAIQSTNCRELIELDIRDEQQHQAFMESGIWRTRCMQQIEFAVLQLFDLREPSVWDQVLCEVS